MDILDVGDTVRCFQYHTHSDCYVIGTIIEITKATLTLRLSKIVSRGVEIRVTANNSLYTTPAHGQHVNEEDFPTFIGHDRIEKI